MLKTLITIILVSLFTIVSKAQNYEGQRNRLFAYNVLSSGLIGGIGGAINRDEGEKWHKAFFKNFGKACLGGVVKYQAKQQVFYLNTPTNVPWILPNRLYFFVGHSMVMNASLNKKLMDTYYANLWGMDVRISTAKDAEKRARIRLSVGTLVTAAAFAIDGHDFDLYRSLEYGHLSFNYDTTKTYYGRDDIRGLGGYNVMALRKNDFGYPAYDVIPHETVHIYQNYDTYAISSWYKKKTEHLYNDRPLYKKLKKYVVLDYEPLFNALAYAIQPTPRYFKNFYEYEAEHFAKRIYLQR